MPIDLSSDATNIASGWGPVPQLSAPNIGDAGEKQSWQNRYLQGEAATAERHCRDDKERESGTAEQRVYRGG